MLEPVANSDLLMVNGVVKHIIYDANNFQTFVLKSVEDGKFTCVSQFPTGSLEVMHSIVLYGRFKNDPKYGWEFEAVAKRADVPEDAEGIADYLAKHIAGVGAITAEKIVERFGVETWKVIEESPQSLCEIKGISITKAQKISAEYMSKIGSRDDAVWLGLHKINNATIVQAIKDKYGNDYQDTISENPYVLINDITGIGFKKADDIAATFGFEGKHPFRIAAAIKHVLDNAQNFGHVYLTQEDLLKAVYKLILVPHSDIANVLAQLLEPDEEKRRNNPICFIKLVNDNGAIYEKSMYREERSVASMLHNIINKANLPQTSKNDLYDEMDKLIKEKYGNSFTLDVSQKDAVVASITSPVSVITGGPGTGKTTTLNTIISVLKSVYSYTDDDFALLAPTGKAAKRMSEQTNLPAMTIHRATGWPCRDSKTIDSPNIIVDEMSMADMHIVYALLKATTNVKRLILVGDVDQLPSVGCGNVLKDIISSNTVPVSRLNVIHRQAEESGIIKYSQGIIHEYMFPENSDKADFTFLSNSDPAAVEEQVINMYMNGLPKYLEERGLDPTSVQILTPLAKENYALSAGSFNNKIQAKYAKPNTPKVTFFQKAFYVGDKVMHIKNDYKLVRQNIHNGAINCDGVMNGETGVVIDADDTTKILTVQYGDDIVAYTKDTLSELMLAYALSIHKSQGSEYQAVIIPIVTGGFESIMNKNLLYTAVTRAKSQVIIIGNRNVLARMVHTKFSEKRNTKLAERLQTMIV